MYTNEKDKAIRKALCLSDLVRSIRTGNVEAFGLWLEKWEPDEKNQAQMDLHALLTLEKMTRKSLVPIDENLTD